MDKPRRRFLKSAGLAASLAAVPCDSDAEPVAAAPDTGSKTVPSGLLPTVKLGSHDVTRLIIGANPFYGFSHFNRLFSRHMVEWSTPENVCRTLRQCEQHGINTWQLSHHDRSIADLKRHREEGGKLQWLLLSSRKLEEDPGLIPALAELKPIGIVHHGGAAERRWRNGELGKVRDFLKAVRDSGVRAGLSVHNPALIELVEEQNWQVDFYMTALYYLTRTAEEFQKLLGQRPIGEVYLPEDPAKMFRVIRKTRKNCLCYKVLAAGRLTDSPEQIERAFKTAFDNIKPQDCLIIGMYPRYFDQVADNVARVRRILGA